MDNKLSELSKPVFEIEVSGAKWLNCSAGKLTPDTDADFSDWPDGVNRLYSQEYVSALLARIAELEQKERHNERQNVIDGLAGAGESWSDIEEYMVKWDEERRNG
ncbi:hypothetical protein CS371_17760 (plasmid) [Serratia marcescens]|uniref:hypothetical protein n=1 Tax=Serratia TaxID=613 RepID=UPI000C13507C|nr:hypothetical protein [Serratia marcescens]PHY81396.1 hypothetical protein CS371_17760 [Serratia marcescens]